MVRDSGGMTAGFTVDVADVVKEFSQRVADAGGSALMVGGSVRDAALGMASSDVDIEVHRLPLSEVLHLASTLGTVHDVGASFGVLKVRSRGIDMDISLPRVDSKRPEANRRGISAQVDPFLGITDAARRRDFTVNAIAFDPLTAHVFDPFDGLGDVKARRLRVVDPVTFGQDALRVFRAAQIAARFGLTVDAATADVLASSSGQLSTVSPERFTEELRKLLVKAPAPSVGLRLLHQAAALEQVLAPVAALDGVPQDGRHHPEGDALEHTFQAVDAAAIVARRQGLDASQRFIVVCAALCHDVGKRACFDSSGDAIGHDTIGAQITEKLLRGLRVERSVSAAVVALVREHMKIHTFDLDTVSDSALRRLARRVHPATMSALVWLSEADIAGRAQVWSAETMSQRAQVVVERCARLQVQSAPPPDFVTGRMLIAAGLRPGRQFGSLIEQGNRLQDEGLSRQEALSRRVSIADR